MRLQKLRFLLKKSFCSANDLSLFLNPLLCGGNGTVLFCLLKLQLPETFCGGFSFLIKRLQLIAQQFDGTENRADPGIRLMLLK